MHEPTQGSGNTLDLILSCGIVVSALTARPVTSVISDHFLIKSEATLARPSIVSADVFTTRHIGLSTLTALDDCLRSWLISLQRQALLEIVPGCDFNIFLVFWIHGFGFHLGASITGHQCGF